MSTYIFYKCFSPFYIFTLSLGWFLAVANGLNIYHYEAPVVTISSGNGWTLNGYFKLVHAIPLQQYSAALELLSDITYGSVKHDDTKATLEFHLRHIRFRLEELSAKHTRSARSINWIGSAWKWIAGNPDASDWDAILNSQQQIIDNNNHQYKVNDGLFTKIQEVITKVNELATKYNNINNDNDEYRLEQNILNKILILKDEVNEIVRACQMAKKSIVNTNLLNIEEVNRIVSEVETLPYQNEIEAIEYGQPSVYTNGSTLLYVLALPKIKTQVYHHLIIRGTIKEGAQVVVPYKEVLVSRKETYGIINKCLSIANSTICSSDALQKIPEDQCLPRILQGGHADCQMQTNNEQIVEMVNENTIFITNFIGMLTTQNTTTSLNGTYVIQLHNEEIILNNNSYTSMSATTLQALPPILANVTTKNVLLDLGHISNLTLKNVKYLSNLTKKIDFSLLTGSIGFLFVAIAAATLWRGMNRRLDIPSVQSLESVDEVICRIVNPNYLGYHSNGTTSFDDPRNADL